MLLSIQVIQVNEKSNSAGAIPPLPERKAERNLNSSHLDSRKLSVQSSASTGSTERKPRKTSRTSQGVSLNEVNPLPRFSYLTVILRGRAGYELIYITNEAIGRVGYYQLISGKSEKNNCFSKFSSNSLDFFG